MSRRAPFAERVGSIKRSTDHLHKIGFCFLSGHQILRRRQSSRYISKRLTFDTLVHMGADRFDSLTDEQRHCLRLVAQGYSSKEIAHPLGLHHRAIDQRLDRARRILGEPDRSSAARLFASYEANTHTYDRDTRVTPAVASPPINPDINAATWGTREPNEPEVVREAPASVSYEIDARVADATAKTGGKVELSSLQRVALIVAIFVGLLLAIVATPALHDSFERVANSISTPKDPVANSPGKEVP